MANIDLEVVSLDAAALPQPQTQRFDEAGGTIGRDPSNTLVLTDRHRRVSRLHGRVFVDAQGARILNESTSLPITVDDVQVEYGRSAVLRDGSAIEIGPFILRAVVPTSTFPDPVRTPAPVLPSAPPPLAVPPAVTAPSPGAPLAKPPEQSSLPLPSAQPLDVDRLFGGGVEAVPTIQGPGGGDPFADLLGEALPQAQAGLKIAIEQPPVSLSARPIGEDAPPILAPPDQDVFDLLNPAPASSPAVPVAESAFQPVLPPREANRSGANLIPEDFNPFDLPSSDRRNAVDPLAQLAAVPFGPDDAVGSAKGAAANSIDTLFLGSTSGDADLLSDSAPLGSGQIDPFRDLLPGDGSTDPLAGLGGALPPHVPAPMRDDSLLLNESLAIGRVTPSVSPMASGVTSAALQVAEVVPAISGAADEVQLRAAFLQGAGLTAAALPQGLTPEMMALVGAVLRNATAGAVDLLAARAATKREVQATVTIISAQANNPLKFVPNADAALQQMLGKRIPGFMRADQAMRDAFDDLRAHEIGVIAGTRAALEEVLAHFDPSRIEQKLPKTSLADAMIPGARKAKLWDLFVERYQQIRQEAVDDFHSVFGRAFVRAYEQETERLIRSENGDAPQ
jgi:FHA domain-containing protein